jgi:superfamily II DNA or RNA helicase
MPTKILTRSGYKINKKYISSSKLKTVKSLLTIKKDEMMKKDVVRYPVYIENENYIIVPLHFGDQHFPTFKIKSKLSWCNTKGVKFTGSLRDYQIDIVKKIIHKLKTQRGGMVSLSCGLGKTCIGLYIACYLKVKTLVVVGKGFLQDQWMERISQFTNASAGIIRGDTIENDKDIVIGMVNSISIKNYSHSVFDKFGLVIVDECHTVASQVFCKSLQKIGSPFNLGLSATPDRKDGLIKVVKWYIGDIIVDMERKGTNNVVVKCINYYSDNYLFQEKKRNVFGKVVPDTIRMTSNVCNIESRKNIIIKTILSLNADKNRKILILGERNNNIKQIKKDIDNITKNKTLTGLYIGGMKREKLDQSSTRKIIFSNYKMASTGLDISGLNTLIMINGKKDIVQSVGRILRKPLMKGDSKPVIVDILDCFSCFLNWGCIRLRAYRKFGYRIDNYIAFDDQFVTPKTFLEKNNQTVNEDSSIRTQMADYFVSNYEYGNQKKHPFYNLPEKDYQYSTEVDDILKTQLVDTDEKVSLINNMSNEKTGYLQEDINGYFKTDLVNYSERSKSKSKESKESKEKSPTTYTVIPNNLSFY